jgi:hypothetical protein
MAAATYKDDPMQPWRPRPGVFSAYERAWRADRNQLVDASNATKALQARKAPRALSRLQTNVFDGLSNAKQQVRRDESTPKLERYREIHPLNTHTCVLRSGAPYGA